jgi:hypothetical protein
MKHPSGQTDKTKESKEIAIHVFSQSCYDLADQSELWPSLTWLNDEVIVSIVVFVAVEVPQSAVEVMVPDLSTIKVVPPEPMP